MKTATDIRKISEKKQFQKMEEIHKKWAAALLPPIAETIEVAANRGGSSVFIDFEKVLKNSEVNGLWVSISNYILDRLTGLGYTFEKEGGYNFTIKW